MLRIHSAVLGCALLCAALAGAAGQEKAPPGTIAVVEVITPHRITLRSLAESHYVIASVRNGVATLYASPQDVAALRRSGYAVHVVEEQPAPKALSDSKTLGVYHSYAGVTDLMQSWASSFPEICRLESIGQSVQGRELWAMKITAQPDLDNEKPKLKYVGTMHGDEPLGTELCLYFIDLLLNGFGSDPRLTALVEEFEIWVMPLMNPDGLEAGTRFNATGLDLNRSFPEGSATNIGNVFDGPPMTLAGRPLEVVHLMQWSALHRFVLSANLHAGSLVVNYPYDNDGKGAVNSPTPDDALFQDIARAYSVHNWPMWSSPQFVDGITNGAAWYVISGGMQDWHYRYLSCNEVTIELSNTRRPPESTLGQYWDDNREAMLAYFETARRRVHGIVTDAQTGQPLHAAVRVSGNAHLVFTNPNVGDYHRMLLPGTYELIFRAPGYEEKRVAGVVVTEGQATRLDVALEPAPESSAWTTLARSYPALLAGRDPALRKMRDAVVTHSDVGAGLIAAFYRVLPQAAALARRDPAARLLLWAFIAPSVLASTTPAG